MKLWGNKLWGAKGKYSIYIRFSPRVSVQELAKTLGRKGIPDFGIDRNNTLSASWIFTKTSKKVELNKSLEKLYNLLDSFKRFGEYESIDVVDYYTKKLESEEDVTPQEATQLTIPFEEAAEVKPGVPELFESNPELANAVYEALESLQFDYMSKFGPAPGFEPFWLGVLLGVLSIIFFINTVRRKNGKDDEKSCLPEWKSLGRLGLIMLALTGFGLVMGSLGFILTVFFFVTILLFVLEGVGFLKSLFLGIIFSAVTFLVFRHWMGVELPKGFLGL